MKIHNLDTVPQSHVEPYGASCFSKALGELAGSAAFTVNLDVIAPGAHSAKYHAHSVQEEFFLVLAGSGLLRTATGAFPVKAGDFIAKPAGFANPHTFFNNGDGPLQLLDISSRAGGDVAYYPDDDVYLLRGAGGGVVLAGGSAPAGWTSEPDV